MCFKQYLLDNNLEFEPEDLEREKQEPKVNLKVEETIEIKEIQDLDTYYSTEKVKDLKPFIIRDIRQNIVDKIKENIQKNGYYKARVLTIVKDNEEDLIIADGNHRLQALIDLNIETVPCITYPNGDLYKLSVQGNIAENTFAPLDLFDWLSIIQKLKNKGLIHEQINEKIGLTKKNIDDHSRLLNNILPSILDFAKKHQIGRGNKKLPNGNFNFTEGWFRNSGLYDLNEEYQFLFMKWFCEEKKDFGTFGTLKNTNILWGGGNFVKSNIEIIYKC